MSMPVFWVRWSANACFTCCGQCWWVEIELWDFFSCKGSKRFKFLLLKTLDSCKSEKALATDSGIRYSLLVYISHINNITKCHEYTISSSSPWKKSNANLKKFLFSPLTFASLSFQMTMVAMAETRLLSGAAPEPILIRGSWKSLREPLRALIILTCSWGKPSQWGLPSQRAELQWVQSYILTLNAFNLSHTF